MPCKMQDATIQCMYVQNRTINTGVHVTCEREDDIINSVPGCGAYLLLIKVFKRS